MRKSLPRVGAAKNEAGRAFGFVKIRVPGKDKAVTRQTFTFHIDQNKLKNAQRRDGRYLLRTNLVAEDPAVLWDRYLQLTQIEAAFKCLKSELGIGPIYHQLEHRVEAHILAAFLAYCLSVTLRYRLQAQAPGLTPRAVLEQLASIQDARRFLPDHGSSLPDHAALHRTGRGCRAAAASTQADLAEPALLRELTALSDEPLPPLKM